MSAPAARATLANMTTTSALRAAGSVRGRSSLGCIALLIASGALLPASAAPSGHTTLTAKAGTADAKFGISVSISGSTAVVGAPDEGGMGAAYVFTRRDGAWIEEATLVAPVRVEGAKFGFNVAISGDT